MLPATKGLRASRYFGSNIILAAIIKDCLNLKYSKLVSSHLKICYKVKNIFLTSKHTEKY